MRLNLYRPVVMEKPRTSVRRSTGQGFTTVSHQVCAVGGRGIPRSVPSFGTTSVWCLGEDPLFIDRRKEELDFSN